jgi:hypothetical protein
MKNKLVNTKFNSQNKETLTYGEALEPAMEITDADDAAQYKADWSIAPANYHNHDIEKNKFTLISKQFEDSVTNSLIRTVPLNKDLIVYNLQISELLGENGFIKKAIIYFNKSWKLNVRNNESLKNN